MPERSNGSITVLAVAVAAIVTVATSQKVNLHYNGGPFDTSIYNVGSKTT
jgi:hypothetical protein